jgi:hypothetical protein
MADIHGEIKGYPGVWYLVETLDYHYPKKLRNWNYLLYSLNENSMKKFHAEVVPYLTMLDMAKIEEREEDFYICFNDEENLALLSLIIIPVR